MSLDYVLITAAHNEEAFIELTIKSVISQTTLPKKWIIVSDGSTDRTDYIVESYVAKNDWLELIRLPERSERHFAGKAVAFNTGYLRLKKNTFDVIGNLDADISFEPDFFEFLLGKFTLNPKLGIAGARYIENGKLAIYSFKDVAGQCQLFRRDCFEEIGGYTPSIHGCVDDIAVLTARMNGWETITFSEKTFYHHRAMTTAESNELKAKIKHGIQDYIIGNHPLWELFRVFFQLKEKPFIIGSVLILSGYIWALLCGEERPVSQKLIRFHRNEQKQRLKAILINLLKFKIEIEET